MKRILILTIAFLMILYAFPGCGKRKKASDSNESGHPTSATTTVATTEPQKYTGAISFETDPVNLRLSKIVDIYKRILILVVEKGAEKFALISRRTAREFSVQSGKIR